MTQAAIGQRWISENETELGLGIVVAIDARAITLLFPACDESRVYALKNAPIARIRYVVGDTITSGEGEQLTVEAIEEKSGILTYLCVTGQGETLKLVEARLSHEVQLSRPQDRLLAGQIESNEWYNIRYDTLLASEKLQHASTWGLAGPRLGLIPHQFYIAAEIANRHAPRVLLADEVGLGKTIEAGLIIHRQLLSERIHRVLVVVPEALQHQWLVELLRRFNLLFSLFDEERCIAATEANSTEEDQVNPFQTEQWVITSLEFFLDHPERADQAIAAGWDMLIVDEAHHLAWEEDSPSAAYQLVERFATTIPSVLLLTATPEQLGVHSHFARLRLLDPKRFHSYDDFLQEEQNYRHIAEMTRVLMQQETLTPDMIAQLRRFVDDADIEALEQGAPEARDSAMRALLDRHGTGRLLFRNTREVIKGFPARHFNPILLAMPETLTTNDSQLDAQLYPERSWNTPNWTREDARVTWLVGLLKELKRQKVLLICHHAETALELETYLRLNEGIRTSMFHEEMTLLERDRAAAYFADADAGAQILLCSEIGSEGRNFQFAHHLVLFDLPLSADLLEQRIGRLDRIGQKHPIQIHVPVYQNTAQEVLMRWYHEGLNAFEQTCPAGQSLWLQFCDRLMVQLIEHDASVWPQLITEAHSAREEINARLQEGRDRLLEMNSYREDVAFALVDQVIAQDTDDTLLTYMQRIWSAFGVDEEDHADEHLIIIRPGDHMALERFPGLDEDGLTLCFDRELAQSREDVAFLTWEHPMVRSVMDLIQRSENGNANVAMIRNRGVKAGTVLLETIFRIETIAPRAYGLNHHLNKSFIRVLVSADGKNLTQAVLHETLRKQLQALDRTTARSVIKSQEADIRKMVSSAEVIAQKELHPLLQTAVESFQKVTLAEIHRLQALQRVNPAVRDDEIHWLKALLEKGSTLLAHSRLQLDGLRLVVAAQA